MENLNLPKKQFENPAELALTRADVISSSSNLENTLNEKRALFELDRISEQLGFHKRYVVTAEQAFAIPINYDRNGPVTYDYYKGGLTFVGMLATFATVKIGQLAVAETNVRALCLTFDSALLLPSFETLEEDRLLYTPAYAVSNIVSADSLYSDSESL